VPDLLRVALGNVVGAMLAAAVFLIAAPPGVPGSVLLLDLLICTQATCGARLAARLVREYASRQPANECKRVVIYGAGQAGVMLLREIRGNQRLAYDVRGFVDDNARKIGMRVQTVTVLGAGADLPALARLHAIEEVLIAIPSAGGLRMTRILEFCRAAGLPCKTIPSLSEIIDGGLAPQIRDVDVDDLLGRTPVKLDEGAIRFKLSGRVVIVTGAAGSIGSELCRQVARFHPRAIIAFDCAETPLFHIEQEMRASFPGVSFHPEIGSIQDPRRVGEIFARYSPSVLYHAAAYKHVPMMESAIFSAVENNILGTANVAMEAMRHNLEHFVMISSDKAVRPSNVMGLTKRAAELVIGSLQNGPTIFVSVRFGNVLGSNGSVIPIFKQQIAAGGPVTVTHPSITRYFMTIPEAVQLVLQASTMATGGEIFVLDMGQPVKIIDLASNLIRLSGLQPGADIKIQISGLRPGEKLYEELHSLDEGTLPTYHDKIKIFAGPVTASDEMSSCLRRIRELCATRNMSRLVLELRELVPDYTPSSHILGQLVPETHAIQLSALLHNVNGDALHTQAEPAQAELKVN
jgi:FlaA1/EpsC-like NDP-sugar epimerase